ncbi:MAG: DNA methyltransferase [Patescibacteria group bacterium]
MDKITKKRKMVNTLNDLNGTEWVKFLSSFFIFNALPKDLKEERDLTNGKSKEHPATYSSTMIESFVKFFTKEGQVVLDPFVGIGSTLVACDRTNRKGIGIELNPKYTEIAKKRTTQKIIVGNSMNINELDLPTIDYCISSPPYWNVLNRSTKDFKNKREKDDLDVKYSKDEKDLGNIDDYEQFLDELYKIYEQIYKILKPKGYITVIIKNVKKEGKLYPLAWDLAKRLGTLYVLKDEKIWAQDKVGLAPYGYPHAWVSNIIHHYCLILRKE